MKNLIGNLNIEKNKSVIWIILIVIIPIALLYRILFLGELIRASDIVTQYYWAVVDYGTTRFPYPFLYPWQTELNFGSDGTNGSAIHYLPWRLLIYVIFPMPVSIGWEIVIHLIFAGIGTFIYCKNIGLNRFSSFLSAMFFILSSEIITLINAGHVGKICAITWTPWVFLALEKGLQERKPFYFLLTGGALALQFYQMHWQISFYTCLAVGLYFIFRVLNIYLQNKDVKESGQLSIYAVLMVIVFFAASALSFLPVYEWSKTTERAGGMAYEDAMSWSMPPEEIVTFLIPGFFGLSRIEGGVESKYIDINYWGRMWFAQATDYLGILPLVLAGTALLYKRNWYTKFFFCFSALILIMGLGKYTPIYRFMYFYLPGFSTFRVPKMILFLFGFGISIMGGLGTQWLFFDDDERKIKRIRHIIYGLAGILFITAILTLYAFLDRNNLIQIYKSDLSRAFRWRLPPDIAFQRFMNIIWGAVSFMAVLGVVMAVFWASLKEYISKSWLLLFVTMFFIVDVWSVNGRFIETVPDLDLKKSGPIRFFEKDKDLFRVATFAGEQSWEYVRHKISTISSYVAVSEKDYAEYLDRIDLDNNLLDLMNVKYVTLKKADINNAPVGSLIAGKYLVVNNDDPDIAVLVSRSFLPRAYPVHQVVVEKDRELIFNILNHPQFRPKEMIVLNEAPPQKLSESPLSSASSRVDISRYSSGEITIKAKMAENGFLVLSEKDYPGWKAYVDGKETKIYKADYIMRAVYLSKGAHEIKFEFDPWPYKVGLWLSSTTFLFLIGAVVWRVRSKPVEFG